MEKVINRLKEELIEKYKDIFYLFIDGDEIVLDFNGRVYEYDINDFESEEQAYEYLSKEFNEILGEFTYDELKKISDEYFK